MSATLTSRCARLVAAALAREAARSQAHRRLYLGTHAGARPQEVFDALMADPRTTDIRLPGLNAEPLRAIEVVSGGLGEAGRPSSHVRRILLIPYLITRPAAGQQNSGTEGFAALLRSRFIDGSQASEIRVFTVLHDDPVETIKTAAEDAGSLDGLSWSQLCDDAAANQRRGSPAAALLDAVALDLARFSHQPHLLEQLAAMADRSWSTSAEAGTALCQLSIYVADPDWAPSDVANRLQRSRDWRQRLDRWSEPSRNFEVLLQRNLGDTPLVDTILEAVGPGGIDYSRFTLDQLIGAQATDMISLRRVVRGPVAAMLCTNGPAAWFNPGTSSLVVSVSGRLADTSAELRWADGLSSAGTVDRERHELSFQVAGDEGTWRFGELAVTRSKRTVASWAVAAYFSEGTWFPVEGGLVIDVDNEAFVVEDEATAYLVSSPRNLGRLDLPTTGLMLGMKHLVRVERGLESHLLPLYLVGEGTIDDRGGGPVDIEIEVPDDEEVVEEKIVDKRDVPSPVHAMHAAGSPDIVISERGEPASDLLEFTVGAQPFRLAVATVAGADALDLERDILNSPETWVFKLTAGDKTMVEADQRLDPIPMESVGRREYAEFVAARAALFAALKPFATAYAVVDDSVRDTARAYVASYASLLESLPDKQRGNPEVDRCLLIDSISTPGGDARFVAPTNPLTIAFYLTLYDVMREWCLPESGLLPADLGSVSQIALLPVLSADDEWYEASSQPGFLWRTYEPLDEALPAMSYNARFIKRKLSFFLDVHPAYRDPRQTLTVSVFAPGDAAALVEGLRMFYRHDLRAETEYSLPQLDLRLITTAGETPSAINDLLAGAQGTAIDRLVRSRVQVTVLPADTGRVTEGMPDFSHVTFIHRTTTARHPGPVELSERASTRYVSGLATSAGRLTRPRSNEVEFFWGSFGQASVGALGVPSERDLERINRRALEIVGSQHREMLQPGLTRMVTTTIPYGFLEDVYENSIWVVHLERLVGLELFAPRQERPQRYLIDYDESFAGQGSFDGITATEHVGPYLNAIRQALQGFDVSPDAMDTLLNRLNAIAGSWALQLLHSSPQDILEKVGIAAAAAVVHDLDKSFDLRAGTGVLLSMEEVISRMPTGVRPPDAPKSDDLVFVWMPHESRPVLRLRVIEVKFASTGGADVVVARQQLAYTCDWVERTFSVVDASRLFRARDLAELIRAAAIRNATFRLGPMRSNPAPDFERALEEVASGRFSLEAGFWVGGTKLRGDVVAVEMESTAPVTRQAGLPGAGDPFGLIRVGRSAIADLSDGKPVAADGKWEPAAFHPPGAAGSVASPEPRPSPQQPQEAREPQSHAELESRSQAEPKLTPRETIDEVHRFARELDAAVLKYGLELEPFRPQLAQIGPSVIRFRTKPLGRQALEGVVRRAADLGREVGAPEGVLVSQEPYFITIDVPRREREIVHFADHVGALQSSVAGALNFLLGIAPSGEVFVEDIARLPHLLIAGATGSGKSVLLRSILCSLMLVHPPQELRVLLIDPKQIDFMPFESAPHLVNGQIVSDPQQAVADLEENIEVELSRRRPILRSAGVSNALEFYEGGGSRRELPQMVIVVDEFADLGSTLDRAGRAAFMGIIQRYGQLTRAYGIYLVLATQRPSVQVITGDIKANMTARIALKLLAPQDSVTILGHAGAESLRDKGDLIFEHAGRRERLQGFFVRPQDIIGAVNRWPSGGTNRG
jgi:hypothetical protein